MADNRVRRTAGGSAVRAKATSAEQRARERIAAERATRKRAEARRRLLAAAGAVTAVLAIVAVLVVVKLTASPAHRAASESAAPATLVRQVTAVPAAVPFLDIGNRFILAGAQYDPQVLAGLSAAQIGDQLSNPSSPVAQAVDGSAKVIIAAIDQVLQANSGRG